MEYLALKTNPLVVLSLVVEPPLLQLKLNTESLVLLLAFSVAGQQQLQLLIPVVMAPQSLLELFHYALHEGAEPILKPEVTK